MGPNNYVRVDAPTRPLGETTRRVLRFIAHCLVAGKPPTTREIGREFGIRSTNGVAYHLALLAERGLIEVADHKACGIRLVGCELLLRYEDSEAGRRLRAELEREDVAEGGGTPDENPFPTEVT